MANHIYWILAIAALAIIGGCMLIYKLADFDQDSRSIPDFDFSEDRNDLGYEHSYIPDPRIIHPARDIRANDCPEIKAPAFDFCRAPARDPKTGRFMKREKA